jgi:hypothetical protein
MGEIEKRGFRLYKDYQKPYSLWDQRDWNSQIRIPCYMIYDPTNGIFSCGDIIFHRREERENYLFTYPGFEVLKKNNFQMKDIKYLFISK